MVKVTVWFCSKCKEEHEILEDLKEAYCPKCGSKMESKGGYEE